VSHTHFIRYTWSLWVW